MKKEKGEREMKNPVLDDIMNYATEKLVAAYGYCGQAARDDVAMLNSDDKEGNVIKIVISAKKG